MRLYTIQVVEYHEDGTEDRAYDPMEFEARDEVDEFIADMGSRWCLYPNVEIYRQPNIFKRFFGYRKPELVVGYGEFVEYTPMGMWSRVWNELRLLTA